MNNKLDNCAHLKIECVLALKRRRGEQTLELPIEKILTRARLKSRPFYCSSRCGAGCRGFPTQVAEFPVQTNFRVLRIAGRNGAWGKPLKLVARNA